MKLTEAWPIFEEGSVVETAQWMLLAASVLLCTYKLVRERKTEGRSFLVLLILFFITLFLREVDVEDLALPGIFVFLGSGIGRDLWLGASWVVYGWFAFTRRRWWFAQARHLLLRTRPGWAFVLACACYGAGWIFDKEWLPIGAGGNLVAEESIELVGCLYFFLSALLLARFGVKKPPSPQPPKFRG